MEIVKGGISSPWGTWTPSLNWGTGIPADAVTLAKYKQVGKTIFFSVKITSTDGNNASSLTVTLPVVPKTDNISPAVLFQNVVGGGSNTNKNAYIRDNGTNNDIVAVALSATDGSAYEVRISGFYEID